MASSLEFCQSNISAKLHVMLLVIEMAMRNSLDYPKYPDNKLCNFHDVNATHSISFAAYDQKPDICCRVTIIINFSLVLKQTFIFALYLL